jgi:hypothetical protein
MSDRVTLGLAAEASIHEEPGAGKLHAGICAGAVGQLSPTAIPFASRFDFYSAFSYSLFYLPRSGEIPRQMQPPGMLYCIS